MARRITSMLLAVLMVLSLCAGAYAREDADTAAFPEAQEPGAEENTAPESPPAAPDPAPEGSEEPSEPEDTPEPGDTPVPGDPSESEDTPVPGDPSESEDTPVPGDPSESEDTPAPGDPSESEDTPAPGDPSEPEDTPASDNGIMPIDVGGTYTWSLTTASGETITQDTYGVKFVLMVFVQAGKNIAYYGQIIQQLDAAAWAGNDAIQIVAVLMGSDAGTAAAFQQQYAPGSEDIVVAYGNDNLIWTLSGSSDRLSIPSCAILQGGKCLDFWGPYKSADDCRQRLAAKGVDFTMETTVGLGVTPHSPEKIQAFADSHPAPVNQPTYSVQPSLTAPFAAGVLDPYTQNSALNMLNQVRYIAGLSADVALDDGYSALVSAATLLNRLNGKLSHVPAVPDGMSASDQLYIDGCQGARSANIASGYASLEQTIVHGWMNDGDAGNIDHLGHRRWIINPSMGKVGFGYTDRYSAMYAHDRSGSGSAARVAWPAQEMPVQYFDASYPWSLSVGYEVEAANVSVTLVRSSDSKTWTFSGTNTYSPASTEYFGVDNQGFGQPGCIIFRPADLGSIKAGDTFDVTVVINDGTIKTNIKYTVHFFDLTIPALDPCAKNGHSSDGGKITKEPTCVDKGVKTYTCTVCGTVLKTEDVDALGHQPSEEPTVTKPATCTEPGEQSYVCQRCGEQINAEPIPATGHSSDGGKITKEPTCVDKGVKTYTCTVCGTVLKTEEVTALGHQPSEEPTVTKPATCTEPGEQSYVCQRCGEQINAEPIPATGHSSDGGKITKEPTCVDKGVKTYKCTVCGAVLKTEDVDALGHQPSEEPTVTKPATCTEPGEQSYVCQRCGEQINAEPIPATGHSSDEGKITKEPTCVDKGVKTYTCTVCGTVLKTEEVTALGHQPGDEPTVTKPATCTEPGEQSYVCQRCGKQIDAEPIPALGHSWGEPVFTWTQTDGVWTGATATRICKNAPAHKENAEATVRPRRPKPPMWRTARSSIPPPHSSTARMSQSLKK